MAGGCNRGGGTVHEKGAQCEQDVPRLTIYSYTLRPRLTPMVVPHNARQGWGRGPSTRGAHLAAAEAAPSCSSSLPSPRLVVRGPNECCCSAVGRGGARGANRCCCPRYSQGTNTMMLTKRANRQCLQRCPTKGGRRVRAQDRFSGGPRSRPLYRSLGGARNKIV